MCGDKRHFQQQIMLTDIDCLVARLQSFKPNSICNCLGVNEFLDNHGFLW